MCQIAHTTTVPLILLVLLVLAQERAHATQNARGPSAPRANVHVRLGLGFVGDAQLMDDVAAAIVPKLSPHMQLVDHRDYLAHARALRVASPFRRAGLRRVGRDMRLTHVVLFVGAQRRRRPRGGAARRRILVVRLFDVARGAFVWQGRHALPGGTLDDVTAARTVASLRWMLLAEKNLASLSASMPPADPMPLKVLPQADEAGADSAGTGSSRINATRDDKGFGADDAAKRDRPGQAAPMEADSLQQATGTNAQISLSRDHGGSTRRARLRLCFALVPSVAMRRAALGATAAPSYGGSDGNGFAPAMPGLALRGSLYGNPNVTHFGGAVEVGGQMASLPVTDAAANGLSHSLPWQVAAEVGYRVFDSGPAVLVPRIGASYARFMVSRGPFVGTAYHIVDVGLRLLPAPWWHGRVCVQAAGSVGLVAAVGGELARLGHFAGGVTWGVAGMGSLVLRGYVGGLEVGLQQVRTRYTGQTALFSTQSYQRVSLVDATLSMRLLMGWTWG